MSELNDLMQEARAGSADAQARLAAPIDCVKVRRFLFTVPPKPTATPTRLGLGDRLRCPHIPPRASHQPRLRGL